MKKWKVWQKEWPEKLIWEGTDADAKSWRSMGYMVEEFEGGM